jgi:bifunctional UDP-N-acetylglucosamine pyrophosphorylase / glucosamine-1-phosphate N-acetyltransferase
MNSDLAVVVLAAGQGTRMRSSVPKVLHRIGGKPLLRHVLDTADVLASDTTVVVLAPDTLGAVRAELGPRYTYVAQAERLGTGHALQQAQGLLSERPSIERVLVLFGDTPLLRPQTAQALVDGQRASGAPVALLSFVADPPTGYGRVVRDAQQRVVGIVEERDASREQRAINEVASGLFCFAASFVWKGLAALRPSASNGEYYLTALVATAVAAHGPGAVVAVRLDDAGEALGINDRAQLAQAEAALKERTLQALWAAGVTIIDPASTYVEADVVVGRDSVLWPGCVLRGATTIGEGCTLGPQAQIDESVVGDGSVVGSAVLSGVRLPAGSVVPPFSVLRGVG